jgi:hypothetical protein
MNWFDQGNWQISRFWRLGNERVEYFFLELLRNLRWGNNGQAGDEPSWLATLILGIAIVLAVIAGVALLYFMWRLVWLIAQNWQRGVRLSQGRQIELARPGTVTSWLEQAQQLYTNADYAGACRALYMAFLIRLDEGQWLRQDPARTDREYLRRLDALWVLAKKPLQLRDAFYQILNTHEQIEFAGRPVSAENFQTCQQAYQQLETELADKPNL